MTQVTKGKRTDHMTTIVHILSHISTNLTSETTGNMKPACDEHGANHDNTINGHEHVITQTQTPSTNIADR